MIYMWVSMMTGLLYPEDSLATPGSTSLFDVIMTGMYLGA